MPDGRGRGRDAQAKAARLEALKLRLVGLSDVAIAAKIGRSRSWVYWAINKALDEQTVEKAEQVRKIELARLDQVQQRVYLNATNGNLPAVDRLLKIMERRAKYLDLDNPRLSASVEDATGLLGALAAQLVSMPDTYEPVVDDMPADSGSEPTHTPPTPIEASSDQAATQRDAKGAH